MRAATVRALIAAAFVLAIAAGCAPGLQVPGAVPAATLPSREELDPGSACVADPDPANGGRAEPPAPVVEAGDPADPTGVVAIDAVGLGDLVLPSDRLFVADVFALVVDTESLEGVDLQGFTGRAPVCLHIARYEPADQRVAFVHVRLGDEPVVRWEHVAGFGVDGGTGGIASAEAVEAIERSEIDAVFNQYFEVLDRHSVDTWAWLNIETGPGTGANVIGFSTGFGDGGYPVVAGYDAQGRVAAVVIDHLVVPWAWLSRVGPIQS
jgi:hypothetical protein